jgi:hypothetical protein
VAPQHGPGETAPDRHAKENAHCGALMDGMLEELAQAATAGVDPARLRGLVAHFWDNRRLGKSVFGAPLGIIVWRRLGELVEAALDARQPASARTYRARACYIAAGRVGLLHAWVSGEVSADSDEIAAVLAAATS